MDFLHNELLQIVEHIGKAVWISAAPCFDIGQKRFCASIKLDDFGHERIDRFIVRHACTGRIRNRDIACAIDIHNARHAQHAVGIER